MAPFKIFTSLRYDVKLEALHNNPDFAHAGWNYRRASPCYMLDFHRDRMLRASTYWGWDAATAVLSGDAGLARLETTALQGVTAEGKDGKPARVRILIDQEGELEVGIADEKERTAEDLFPKRLAAPEEEKAAPRYTIVLDDAGTEKSAYTHYKTTKREKYNGAMERAGIKVGDPKEVLLAADDGGIMEASLTTPYFWRGGRWVTPPVRVRWGLEGDSGGQDGTTRRWAIESGYAVEEMVQASSIVDGELIWLSNGAKGFILGKFEAKRT
ncbi:hypothetical protein jhhlp_006381 [Lomentospora prolificans]|uniref:Aminotransferase class IV n=1 Tax=Lomentospora prolificans TaxID=41688 RepID=A0A2N3N5Q0_9PEZI|nr:hypothetical protein jhhlp_006381 [Lomentospora prolificans]